MKTVGVVGLGDMGSGLAKNLLKHGFNVQGADLLPHRQEAFRAMGGQLADCPADVGRGADAVFVMVMTGEQAKSVILAPDGLLATMAEGSAIVLSATIKPQEARDIGAQMHVSGVDLIDSPVSGGFPGRRGAALPLWPPRRMMFWIASCLFSKRSRPIFTGLASVRGMRRR